ncbi:ANTAR domain-containing protein [Streptomyces sp. RY43-2]|uniref:ANTAR domain-containing protein n=1 Tax=Streptomyces macrolidinus TaxID=2952607 RepID=A0ABT0ZF70_9ACTN|nr:ANTAR domain-containing protein [Streptomyces macrolidinus]MCN9242207.1 ANTAR domain-containing protein [Streptomyces macrolidinus]
MTVNARPGSSEPEPDPTGREAERIFQLEEEVAQLKEAVTSHAVVDQAIGMLMALGHVTPDQGWEVLREVSQRANIKLRNVAEMMLVWGHQGDLPYDLRVILEDTLDRYGPTRLPDHPPPR